MRAWIPSSFLLLALLPACPKLEREAAPAAACSKQFERCKTPEGPLGMCDVIPCKNAEKGTCFKCMPQH